MIVLGLDPSICATGWAVVDCERRSWRLLGCGTWRTRPKDEDAVRLWSLRERLGRILGEHSPELACVESGYGPSQLGRIKAALTLAEARGALLSELSPLPVVRVNPASVKKLVGGHGRSSKDAVRLALDRQLARDTPIPAGAGSDATDAVAIAIAGHWIRVCSPLETLEKGRKKRR